MRRFVTPGVVIGPLAGVKVVEFAGIGPAPFCGMMLADAGADVIRIDRLPGGAVPELLALGRSGTTDRGRVSLRLDLKHPRGLASALALIERADLLIEGFRPGVMERLGVGPDVCAERNPRLVYGRMTGWGQGGPLASRAGHDINYIAITGALASIGEPDRPPVPPLNLVGDFGGGAMLLGFGLLCALIEARSSGRGQVVDAAMCDGAALLMANIYSRKSAGLWSSRRGANALDGGAPWYASYACADGKYIAIGAIEPQFHAQLLARCGIDDPLLAPQWDETLWPQQKQRLAEIFRSRTRDEWCALTAGSDACLSPVLDLDEAPDGEHLRARNTFAGDEAAPQPAPRFSRSTAHTPPPLQTSTAAVIELLERWGFASAEAEDVLDGVVSTPAAKTGGREP